MRILLFITVLFFFSSSNTVFSQCKEFAKNECKPMLEGYMHDGNYNGVVLNIDEDVELHKAFFGGQKYRMVVCREDYLPPIHFKLLNSDFEVLYDNQEAGFANTYDFELEKSETLIISMKFVNDGEDYDKSMNGCVVILFGLKM
ncbi:hypothetical protein [Marinifilum caeruleilacunae]|uniref:Uncharacterized protein n=1 Tax=Marinifilum caeruleilacunae TaxID=2499076 RepID=A0ABX1WWW2_9BACT|nr:hypothetical protein [Marinifilum caeruleilacunae]NOU60615.1 hypothetical protein [Marinifilum caeruleilacunae]